MDRGDGRAWNRTPSRGIVLVVWESSNYYPGIQGDLSGQFFNVGFNGVITPGNGIPGCHSMAHESAPSLAFGGNRFLLTWNSEPVPNDDAHRDIYGVMMTDDGRTAWGEFPITTAPSWQHVPLSAAAGLELARSYSPPARDSAHVELQGRRTAGATIVSTYI